MPLKQKIFEFFEKNDLLKEEFLIVMWEESGGHTLNVLNVSKDDITGELQFKTEFPIIADKYPVPALVLVTELISRGHKISELINLSIKGINNTIFAIDEEKIKIMNNFKKNDGKIININNKKYKVSALSDNNNKVGLYQLKSIDSTLYFRPSGTNPELKFYIFGNQKTNLEEIKSVQDYIKANYS